MAEFLPGHDQFPAQPFVQGGVLQGNGRLAGQGAEDLQLDLLVLPLGRGDEDHAGHPALGLHGRTEHGLQKGLLPGGQGPEDLAGQELLRTDEAFVLHQAVGGVLKVDTGKQADIQWPGAHGGDLLHPAGVTVVVEQQGVVSAHDPGHHGQDGVNKLFLVKLGIDQLGNIMEGEQQVAEVLAGVPGRAVIREIVPFHGRDTWSGVTGIRVIGRSAGYATAGH